MSWCIAAEALRPWPVLLEEEVYYSYKYLPLEVGELILTILATIIYIITDGISSTIKS
jgi:hypothetical protein